MRTRAQQGCGKAGAGGRWRVPEALMADDARPAGRVVQPRLVQLKAAAHKVERVRAATNSRAWAAFAHLSMISRPAAMRSSPEEPTAP